MTWLRYVRVGLTHPAVLVRVLLDHLRGAD
jgi:hypothetical protein